LGSTDYCNWKTVKKDGEVTLVKRGIFRRVGKETFEFT